MEETKYYYIAFTFPCCGVTGCYSLAQVGGDGFNVGGAHRFLLEKFAHIPVITFWQQIPKNQHDGLFRFNDWFNKCLEDGSIMDKSKHKPGLSVVDGSCMKPTPPKGDLKPVPPDDKKE